MLWKNNKQDFSKENPDANRVECSRNRSMNECTRISRQGHVIEREKGISVLTGLYQSSLYLIVVDMYAI